MSFKVGDFVRAKEDHIGLHATIIEGEIYQVEKLEGGFGIWLDGQRGWWSIPAIFLEPIDPWLASLIKIQNENAQPTPH